MEFDRERFVRLITDPTYTAGQSISFKVFKARKPDKEMNPDGTDQRGISVTQCGNGLNGADELKLFLNAHEKNLLRSPGYCFLNRDAMVRLPDLCHLIFYLPQSFMTTVKSYKVNLTTASATRLRMISVPTKWIGSSLRHMPRKTPIKVQRRRVSRTLGQAAKEPIPT